MSREVGVTAAQGGCERKTRDSKKEVKRGGGGEKNE